MVSKLSTRFQGLVTRSKKGDRKYTWTLNRSKTSEESVCTRAFFDFVFELNRVRISGIPRLQRRDFSSYQVTKEFGFFQVQEIQHRYTYGVTKNGALTRYILPFRGDNIWWAFELQFVIIFVCFGVLTSLCRVL